MWDIDFISQEDFEKNIYDTVLAYFGAMKSIDLNRFNRNVIDPIKLLFDMKVYGKTQDELVEDEINRQIDKTNSNSIGYFHQNMFKYINNCIVPSCGFDIIYTNPHNGQKIYVEMKNKHNTMNDGGKNTVLEKMQAQIAKEPSCKCYLVEVISGRSRDEVWTYKRNTDNRIRRVSIDKFFYEVTGERDSFKQICNKLPELLDKVISTFVNNTEENVPVINSLKNINPDIIKAMFLLAFSTYEGFKDE